MSALRKAAEDYLAMRRALGFKLTTWGRHLMGSSTTARPITPSASAPIWP